MIVSVPQTAHGLFYNENTISQDVGEHPLHALESAPEKCQGLITAVALQRMIENLIDNALRYGGNVARVTLPPPRGEELVVNIEDSGRVSLTSIWQVCPSHFDGWRHRALVTRAVLD
ncbi:hypothetical protein LK533_16870 [Sphingomonas sp. PL-96]|uniref:ATP-binding protein n=1 Tax=Sphingomonas sp. PL-96 TaxID=2887201 RepID=UPI001E496180|nr:ATP-binding protein [Sphingomonas sp. PL-96]MCC2978323.1 hypothetical protein [Sphingomonas sp. PL-96]